MKLRGLARVKPRARLVNGQWEVRSCSNITNPCKGHGETLQLAYERYRAATWYWFNGPDYRALRPGNGGW